MLASISVNNLEVFAYHGCMEEEAEIGTRFSVNAHLYYDISKAALSDDLKHAVDYGEVSAIVKEELLKRNNLIETVVVRIINRLKAINGGVEKVRVELTKHKPPIEVNVESVTISLEA